MNGRSTARTAIVYDFEGTLELTSRVRARMAAMLRDRKVSGKRQPFSGKL